MTPLVTICIIHYGSDEYLRKCLESLQKATYNECEIIIIDNNALDHDMQNTYRRYAGTRVFRYIRNERNTGFAEGCNQGILSAQGKYIFLLNNDIELDPECIRYLVDFAEENPEVAVIQPKMLDFTDRTTFHSSGAGGFIDIFGYPFARGRIFDAVEKDTGQYDDIVEVFWASGAALFARTDVLKESGLFDPDFFLYMEEIDLEWRVHLLGYKVVYIPYAIIYHIGCPTLGRENYFRMYYTHRNSMIMLMKNLSPRRMLTLLPFRVMLELGTAMFAVVTLNPARFRAVFRALLHILGHMNPILRKRHEVQAKRMVTDKIIFSNAYHGSVVFRYFLNRTVTVFGLKNFQVKKYIPQRRKI